MSRHQQERDRLGLPAQGGSDTEVAGAIGGIARLRTGRYNKVSQHIYYISRLFFKKKQSALSRPNRCYVIGIPRHGAEGYLALGNPLG